MAEILPPVINEDNPSNAEIKIFNLLKSINDDNLLIFHSLELSDHLTKVFGEIDFLLISNEGILCLEVKGGRIKRENGIWYYIDRHGNYHKNQEGPFTQARKAMYSLKKYIEKELGETHPISKCQYAYGVAFTDIYFNQEGPEIIQDIIFDTRYERNENDFLKYKDNCFKYFRNKLKEKHNFEGGYLNHSQIKHARNLLRGNFGVVPSLKREIDQVDEKLIRLTEEQMDILECLSNNDRIIIEGGAGTGKTLLAVEQAKKMALKNKKVLFLFFNKLIAYRINQIFTQDMKENIDAFNLHNLLLKVYNKYNNDHSVNKLDDNFYTSILPEKFLDFIGFSELKNKYDVLIIDEGQDLIKENYLMCMNELLKGGLDSGKWTVLYDPKQNIYNQEFINGKSILESINHANYKLKINCRNTKKIGDYNTILTAFKSDQYLKIEGGQAIKKYYSSHKELKQYIKNEINKLLNENIKPGDITILSTKKYKNSFLEGENLLSSCPIIDISKDMEKYNSDKYIKFSTIHSFKGLDSKIVFITDIDDVLTKEGRILNYTAISRARVKLYFLYNKQIESDLNEIISEGVKLI